MDTEYGGYSYTIIRVYNGCNGVNYGSCIRASYGCFQLRASHGATDDSDI